MHLDYHPMYTSVFYLCTCPTGLDGEDVHQMKWYKGHYD